jgi:hypothetical protein
LARLLALLIIKLKYSTVMYALESVKKSDLLLLFVLAKRDQVRVYLMIQA